jgi:Permease family
VRHWGPAADQIADEDNGEDVHPVDQVLPVTKLVRLGLQHVLAMYAGAVAVPRALDRAAIARGLRADGVGTILGGIFNTFPYTSFSQNVGLVGVTGVRSRWVTATGGIIMLALGLLPKLSALGGAPGRGVGRRRNRHVRDGRCHWRAHPHQCRFQDQPLQFVHSRHLGRPRDDSLDRAQLLQVYAGRASSAVGIGHPIGGDRFRPVSMFSSTA